MRCRARSRRLPHTERATRVSVHVTHESSYAGGRRRTGPDVTSSSLKRRGVDANREVTPRLCTPPPAMGTAALAGFGDVPFVIFTSDAGHA